MFFTTKATLNNLIVDELRNGSVETLDLIERIKRSRLGTTKQGVYSALRSLKKEEVIVISKRKVSLSLNWLERVQHFLEGAQHQLSSNAEFALLHEGDSVQYQFRTLTSLVTNWIHVSLSCMPHAQGDTIFYSYTPNYWTIHSRTNKEKETVRYVTLEPPLRFVCNDNALNRLALEKVEPEYMTMHFLKKPLFKNRCYYASVFGDFVFEARLDKKVNAKIEEIYNSATSLTGETLRGLRGVMEMPGKHTLRVSNNSTKADKLRKKLKKYF